MSALVYLPLAAFCYLGLGIIVVGFVADGKPISAKGWFMVGIWPALAVAFIGLCIFFLCLPSSYDHYRRKQKARR